MNERNEVTISVLLPVYDGVQASHFNRALESVFDQTLPPDEVVVVEDGPLSSDLHRVIERFARETRALKRVVLDVNGGAGLANDAGLRACRGTWIAKMDADDISVPRRFETQLNHVRTTGVDVLGSYMAEFSESEEIVDAVRTAPLTHSEIRRRMMSNNPINHPSVFYRRSVALAAGGYGAERVMEDYDLFARMLIGGARMENLPECLVLFRADDSMYRRRASRQAIRCEWQMQCKLHRYGVVSGLRKYANLVIRISFRLLPLPMMRRAYALVFNRPAVDG